ncbi:arginine N-succinyltransferase [Bacteriovoracaceae bacterium]|nr:arginine N-succinyltransferase [Bacteriovoracaceae bacterium]
MYLLRNAVLEDLDQIFELSKLHVFLNLPAEKDKIKLIIEKSLHSFTRPSTNLWENNYIFVLEDTKNNKVLGASGIHPQHGTPEEPHFYLKIEEEVKILRSETTPYKFKTLRLKYDVDGPTEIGGLVLHPDSRKNTEKLGKQISFVRFLFMAIYPEKFKPIIHSELLPPFDDEGNSPLWEALGRKFLKLNYQDADLLSRKDKNFILDLFPSTSIYQCLLPEDVQKLIGKVGQQTLPVKKMLEKIGFKYNGEVDPFDGGPHLQSPLDQISIVRDKVCGSIKFQSLSDEKESKSFLINLPLNDYHFSAIKVNAIIDQDKIIIDKEFEKFFENDKNFKPVAIPF